MRQANVDWDKLTVVADGVTVLRPCRDLVFYWSGSAFDRADGLVSFFHRSLDLLRPHVRFFRTETMRAAQPVKRESFDLVPFWLRDAKSRRQIYMLSLESGRVADEPSDVAFSLKALEAGLQSKGFIRLIMPVEFADEPDGAFANLAMTLGRDLDFAFGQAGFSVNWNDLGEYQMEAMNGMRKLASRYPGIDLASPSTTMYAVAGGGIKCVNWLTFLSAEHAARLGGAEKLRQALGADIPVRALSRGVAIQAGPAPEIGDVNHKQDLPSYRRVGSVLAPLRSRNHPPFLGVDGLPSAETTQKWLGRFDR